MTYYRAREDRLDDHFIGPLSAIISAYAGLITRTEALISMLIPGPIVFKMRNLDASVAYKLVYDEYVCVIHNGEERASIHVDMVVYACGSAATEEISLRTKDASPLTRLDRAIDRHIGR